MLLRARQLVEQGGFAAVLVAHQRKRQRRVLGQRISAAFRPKAYVLTKARVRAFLCLCNGALLLFRDRLDGYLLGVGNAQRQLVAVKRELHRVSHRRELHQSYLGTRDHAHVKKMLPKLPLSANGAYNGGLPRLHVL